MKKYLNILALAAHPDDLELLCAGTLIKFSKLGHRVAICHVCNGDKGNKSYSSEELTKIRHSEAIESAKIINASTLWVGIPDGEVVLDLETRIKIIDVIR